MQSPCLTLPGRDGPCDYQHRDKNHPDCVDCRFRLEYAVNQGMLHPEVLTKQEDPVVLEAREKGGRPRGSFKEKVTCSVDGCAYWAVAKGKCRSHYGKAYRKSQKLKRKTCKDCKRRPVKTKELCNACYVRARYKRIHGKVRGYRRKGKEMNNERDKV